MASYSCNLALFSRAPVSSQCLYKGNAQVGIDLLKTQGHLAGNKKKLAGILVQRLTAITLRISSPVHYYRYL